MPCIASMTVAICSSRSTPSSLVPWRMSSRLTFRAKPDCFIFFFTDETRNDVPKDLGDRVFDLYHEALRRSLGWYQPPEVRDVDFFDLSFDIACNMQLTNEEQQLLLELTDTRERLQAEEKLLEMAIAELDRRLSTFGANGHISLN